MYVMVRLSFPQMPSWQLPQVLRRSTARATSAPGKVPATIIKGVAYHAECALRILDGRRAARQRPLKTKNVAVLERTQSGLLLAQQARRRSVASRWALATSRCRHHAARRGF